MYCTSICQSNRNCQIFGWNLVWLLIDKLLKYLGTSCDPTLFRKKVVKTRLSIKKNILAIFSWTAAFNDNGKGWQKIVRFIFKQAHVPLQEFWIFSIFLPINLYDVIYFTKIVDSKDYTALVDICTLWVLFSCEFDHGALMHELS